MVLSKTRLPQLVALPGLDQREVAGERLSSTYSRPSMTRVSLPSATRVPTPAGRVEAADARAARADALGERALRAELDLELAGEELLLEDLVLADVARDHLLDLPGLEQHAEPEVGGPAVVGDDGEVLDPLLVQGGDQVSHQPPINPVLRYQNACFD